MQALILHLPGNRDCPVEERRSEPKSCAFWPPLSTELLGTLDITIKFDNS